METNRRFLGFKVRRSIASSISIGWLVFALIGALAPQGLAQLAPTGEHYAGRPSDTGYGGSFVNATGTFAASIPLELPPARGNLPIPLQIIYGARGVGAAGLGWDLPLSYIQRDSTFAHRRPASSPGALPVPRERASLSLFGQSVELIRAESGWVARSGTLELMVRESADEWLAYDGMGRTYTFVRPAVLGSTGLWLLKSISVAGGASVEINYQIATWPLNGGSGIAIDLHEIDYNTHPTEGCAKNTISLTYGFGSIAPLSMAVLGDKILVRKNTLTLVDVNSRPTCSKPYQRLRRYEFHYLPDTDTLLPRLDTVRMFGRQGTPEENISLPIASYRYGSATQLVEGKSELHYKQTETIALPADVAFKQISGTGLDSSVNAPVTGDRYAMWQTLTDVTGDGRPDLVFKRNNKLWVAYNHPGPNGDTTTIGGAGQATAQLSDATFADGAFSTHTTVKRRFAYGPANRNTVNVWRQGIDVNGDGRIDIVDAAKEPDHWVVYLNTPDLNALGGTIGVKWERRSFSVKRLREELVRRGHLIDGQHLPLSRRATGTNINTWDCWRYDGTNWNWFSAGFGSPDCEGIEGKILEPRGPERTFVEWEFTDLNGDGYPDFIFNSTPVDFQGNRPDRPPSKGEPIVVGGPAFLHQFAPSRKNEIRASFNVVGVRFDTDQDPFSQSVNLFAAVPEQGVSEWGCIESILGSGCIESSQESSQSELAGFVDVNGDGLVDRVVGQDVGVVFLGAYAGTAFTFSKVHITLPGLLATEQNTTKQQCVTGGNHTPTADQTNGLRDLTGDGIPDYYQKKDGSHNGVVWIGTGTGFREAISIVVDGVDFRFSHQTESCDGDKSNTDGGLFDIDGDGRPEIIGLGNGLIVSQLVGGSAPGIPEAGRLTEVDNGYGAKTRITYVSAKHFTDSPVPFPEIVVGSVATSDTHNLGGKLAGTRYAYSNAEIVFDSALDRFSFAGYRRLVELHLIDAPVQKLRGNAVITDTWPLTPFEFPGSLLMKKQERWVRMQRVGRLRDIFTLQGTDNDDPWSFLNVDARSDSRVIGDTHYEWDAKLYETPPSATENVGDCLDMVLPLNYQLSLAAFSAPDGKQGIDTCRAHGFAFAISRESWFGAAPPPSDTNIQTRSRVHAVNGVFAVDDFGHTLVTEEENDLFRSDDNVCIENTFAAPPNDTFPRVLDALASHRIYDSCGKDILASESWTYDNLPAASVSNGRMTSHSVDRRATDTGKLLKTVHLFDATYDGAGNLTGVRAQRDGSVRTTTFDYDSFGLVPTHTKINATGVPSNDLALDYDLVSLQPLRAINANHTKRGIDFDGFGRLIRTTVTPPGKALGVLSTTNYLGFTTTDPEGRRVTVKRFGDPVSPTNVTTAIGRTSAVFFDELGRERRTELALGSDYANDTLVVGSREYDDAGRVVSEVDPYLKNQDPVAAYGTSYYFKNTGDLDCIIRGRGHQALNRVSDVVTERFPTGFQRSIAGHTDTLDVRDAASLEAGSPQSGVVNRVVSTAIGRVIERSTWRNLPVGSRLEYATFGYDLLGQQTSMIRFLNPIPATGPVTWSSQLDSIGQTLQLAEPNTAIRSYSFNDSGEPVETRWVDGGVERTLVSKYDALGRLTATEEHNNGVKDPDTINTYAYDTGVNVSPLVTPAFVLGQLARATSPSGQVTFSYDAFGRMNAQVFTDNQGVVYIEKAEHQADGRLGTLEFNLPDRNYDRELVKYNYDSAGRPRAITYADASGAREIYNAAAVDPFGHVRQATYGGNVVYAASYADLGPRLMNEVALSSKLGSRRISFLGYDPLGRELSRREIKEGAAGNQTTTTVNYDQLGRLSTGAQTDGVTQQSNNFFVRYDALGNILLKGDSVGTDNATLTYQTDDRDRICRIDYGNGGNGGVGCNVSYDAVGNIVHEPTRTGFREFKYFASGDVRAIGKPGTEAHFRYDPFGQVQELDLVSSGTTDTRHDRRYGGLIEVRDQVIGSTTKSFISRQIPGPGGIVASRRGPGNEWVFPFGEPRGNRFFTDVDGAFVQDIDYQPYGESTSSGVQPGDSRYTSAQWNGGDALAAFGLSHLGARLYDPAVGRFLSRDPLLIPRTATTTNPYAFAMNDPLNLSDPSGLDPCGNDQLCISSSYSQNSDSGGWGFLTFIPAIVNGIGDALSSGASAAPPAPAAVAGPQTPAGVGLQVLALRSLGYVPSNYDWDKIGATNESWSDKLDRISQTASPERDAYIAADNAKWDRRAHYARVIGFGVAAGALTFAAAAGAAGYVLAATGRVAAAEALGVSLGEGAAAGGGAGTAGLQLENAIEEDSALVVQFAEGAEETVSVFHGSINNGQRILEQGLDVARGTVCVSRDLAAAQDALVNHYDAVRGLGMIIESRIPVSQFQSVLAPLEKGYQGFFPYNLQSTEIRLSTAKLIDLFNQFRVRPGQ